MSDSGTGRVQKFSAEGALVWVIGGDGEEDGRFKAAMGMASADGGLSVADWGNNRVQVFDREGNFLTRWGGDGDGPGEFANPVRGGGRPGGARVRGRHPQRARADLHGGGEYPAEFGQSGFGSGDLHDPNRVQVAADGTVWVSCRDG